MFYYLGKKFFKVLINLLQGTQIALIFLSFFIILFWLLQLGGVQWIQPVVPFFEGIRSFVHLFYNRTVPLDDTGSIDFSFLIATFLFLFIAWGLKFVIEYTKEAEKKLDSIHFHLKKKREEIFNAGLQTEYLIQESQNNKILMMVSFSTLNLTKDEFYNKDVNDGIVEKEKEILFSFLEILDEDLPCQKEVLGNKILLFFNDFKHIDKILTDLETILKEIQSKYYTEKWQVNSYAGIDVYSKASEIDLKTKKLSNLVNLKLKNEIACLGTFKERYSILKIQKYAVKEKGVYQIMGENEEVFFVKSLR